MHINEKGNLEFANVDTLELVSNFKTPLYVMDEDKIRENCRRYKKNLSAAYGEKAGVIYAGKAFSCVKMCKIIKEEGLFLDVVSGGELFTAIKSGFETENIQFHGNNKTLDEINFAIEKGVGRIVVDNVFELEAIDGISRKNNKTTKILLRIKPNVNANTHKFIKTGTKDSKFGFDLISGEAIEAVKFARALQNVELYGVHCHIGSQIFDIYPFVQSVELMMKLIRDIHNQLSMPIKELNIGGGMPVKYNDSDPDFDIERFLNEICTVIKARSEHYGVECPYLYIEPGRSIVADAGITLYTVGAVKKFDDMKTIISVDGGMTDNPRHILYGSDYKVTVANRANEKNSITASVVGKCCESGDIITENAVLPSVQAGDILAVMCTGAYNYSMASNYNRIPRPPVIMIKDGKASVAVKRETYEDLLKNDV